MTLEVMKGHGERFARSLVLLVVPALGIGVAPSIAFAKGGVDTAGGFDANDMLGDASKEGGFNVSKIDGAAINELVSNIAGWAIGVAVAICVLKIVLTAVDRLILGGDIRSGRVEEGPILHANQHMPKHGGNNDQSLLVDIPIIGAYPPPDSLNPEFDYRDDKGRAINKSFSNDYRGGMTWKQIWLNFAKQLAICVGAWFLVQLFVGIVAWLMGTVTG